MLMEPFTSPLKPGNYRHDRPPVSRLNDQQPQHEPQPPDLQNGLMAAYSSLSHQSNRNQLAALPVQALVDENYGPLLGMEAFECHGLDFSFLNETDPGTPPVNPGSSRALSVSSVTPSQEYYGATGPVFTTNSFGPVETPPFESIPSAHFHPSHNGVFLDEKAADLCHCWLTHFSPCWPEEKDFEAFERLTGESVTRIKTWFGQRLSAHPFHTAIPSSSTFAEPHRRLALPSPPASASPSISRTSSSQGIAIAAAGATTTTTTKTTAATTTPSSHAPFRPQPRHCTPTTTDRAGLKRDPSKPFQCTRACGRAFPRKGEWAKHELKNHPQRVWLCLHGGAVVVVGGGGGGGGGGAVPATTAAAPATPPPSLPPPRSSSSSSDDGHHTEQQQQQQPPLCAFCHIAPPLTTTTTTTTMTLSAHLVGQHWSDSGAGWCGRQFGRKDHLAVHLRTVHGVDGGREAVGWWAEAGRLEVGGGSGGEGDEGGGLKGSERWCGFCRRGDCWRGWRERVDHLGRHFKKEGRSMDGWAEWPGEGG